MIITLSEKNYEPRRIFCIGRNYRMHINELQNETPKEPVVFLKPSTSLIKSGVEIQFPKHGKELHHEVEIVLLIGKAGTPGTLESSASFISGVSVGLDLTLRDVQNNLKKNSLPWEISKAFDYSAPIGNFIPIDKINDGIDLSFSCSVNGEKRQEGNGKDMLFSPPNLVYYIGNIWSFLPGDLIFTGTPSGVGPLVKGDRIEIEASKIGKFFWKII